MTMIFTHEEINEFKEEAFELLGKAEESLLALDKGSRLKPHYDVLLRSFHNIKGAASIIGNEALQHHMHELENLLIRSQNLDTLPKGHFDLFIQGIDAARSVLNGNIIHSSAEKAVQTSTPEVPEGKAPKPTEKKEPAGVSEAALNEFMSECEEISQRLSLGFGKMEKEGFVQGSIDSIYRDAHSLKGSAHLFGFKDLGDLAHAIESSLERVRQKKVIADGDLIDSLFKYLDQIDQITRMIQEGRRNNRQQKTDSAEPSSVHPENPNGAPELATDPDSGLFQELTLKDSNSTIRVPVSLLDRLMALVGEMVLVRNQVIQYSSQSNDREFLNLSQRLNVVSAEIQDEVMKTRMQPIGNVLTKLHRIVRDLEKELGKKIQLKLSGTETELDKTLLEAIKDPLIHIIRNSCDHGIESPQERLKAGKTDSGTISVQAFHEGGQVIISIKDDGKGLDRDRILAKGLEKGLITADRAGTMSDREIFGLIFSAGFSTAAQVSNISGRGVGMDVAKSNIERLGGAVELASEKGRGATVTLKIPLTLAIVPAMIVRSENDRYAIPQVKLLELVRVETGSSVNHIEYIQGAPVYRLRGKLLPLLNLKEVLKLSETQSGDGMAINIAVLNADKVTFGLIVDEIMDTADIVVKPLSRLLKSLQIYSGATVLGDGSVALILDVAGMAEQWISHTKGASEASLNNSNSDVRGKDEDAQDYILFKLNSPTRHAMAMGYVQRLEEFSRDLIEYSGQERVIRYRNSILTMISLNEPLGYPPREDSPKARETVQVIVIRKENRFFGLEVDEILDVLSTPLTVDRSLRSSPGIMGNLITDDEVIVVIDPDYLTARFCDPDKSKRGGSRDRSGKTSEGGSAGPADLLAGQRAHIKVLYVEDTAFIRKHMTGVLERAGYQVVAASNGEEAIQILKDAQKGAFHLVVSDIEMPKLNGFQLATLIRQDPKWKNIPLVAVTSRTNVDYVRKGLESGFTLYFEKINADDLIRVVDQVALGEGKNPTNVLETRTNS